MYRNRQALKFQRDEMTYAVQQYVGKHWSRGGSEERVPINMIAQYVQVIIRSLISQNPQVNTTTFQQQYKPHVAALGAGVNRKLKKMNFAATEQEITLNALFNVGIGVVCLADPAQAAGSNFRGEAGQVFWDSIDLDDFVYDLHAKRFSECSFLGYRSRVPIDAVKDGKYYTKSRLKLEPSYDNPYNLQGDQRLRTLGRSEYINDQDEFEDMVDIWQVYLPRHKCMVTLADDQLGGGMAGDDEALRYQQWLGPDCGPFHFLGYINVPGNAMPVGPIQHLIDLHEAANRAARKLIRMVDDFKEITTYRRGYEKDASRVFDASNGDMVPVDDPTAITGMVTTGKGVPVIQPMVGEFYGMFSRQAGNIETMGGLSPQADTAHQEEILNKNAGAGTQDMQARTLAHTTSMVEAICWYEHYHPENVHRSVYSAPGYPEFQQVRELHPAGKSRSKNGYPQLARDYDYDQMEIQVDPFSMAPDPPAVRMAKIDDTMKNILIPLAPILQSQNLGVDMNAYLNIKAKYINVPEMSEFVNSQEPPEQAGGQDDEQSEGEGPGLSHAKTLPGTTNRTYTRKGGAGQSRGAEQQQRMQQLQGADLGGE